MALTPLTSRVLGAIFMLGITALGVITDARWSAARLMVQVEAFMLTLILLAAARARGDFDTSQVMTWLLLGGFLAALASAGALVLTMNARDDRRRTGFRALR